MREGRAQSIVPLDAQGVDPRVYPPASARLAAGREAGRIAPVLNPEDEQLDVA